MSDQNIEVIKNKTASMSQSLAKLLIKIEELTRDNISLQKQLNRPKTGSPAGKPDSAMAIYSQLFKVTDDVIYTLAPDGVISSLNPAFERILGWPSADWIGKNFASLVHPDDLEKSRKYYLAVLKGESLDPFEIRVLSKSGDYIALELVSSSMILENKIAGVFGMARDITERKRADELLRNNEERLRAALTNSSMILFNQDLDLRYSWIYNPSSDCPNEEILGKTDDEILDFDSAHFAKGLKQRVISSGIGERAEVGLNLTGSFSYYDLAVEPLRDETGEIIGVTCAAIDISARKTAQKALNESEERFRAIFENATIGLFRTTPDGRVLMANPALAKMLGYSSFDELASLNIETDGYHPSQPRDNFRQLMEKLGEVRGLESSLRKADGSFVDIKESARAVRDNDGNILYYEGTIEDITARKQAESELMEAIRKLRAMENIVNRSPVMIFLWKAETGWPIEFASENVEQFGYSSMGLISSACSYMDLISPDDREKAISLTEQFLKEGRHEFNLEYRILTKSGKPRWVDDRRLVRFNDLGEPTHFQGIVFDITEKKRSDEALRISENRYRLLIENANDAIFVAQDGFIKYTNKRLPEILGYTEEKVLMEPFGKYIHIDDREMVMNSYQKRLAGDPTENIYSFRVIANDNSYRWLEVNAIKIMWDDKPASLNFAADITNRRQAEESLIESERKFRALFENSPDASFLLSDKFTDCNNRVCSLWGYSRDEIIGHSPAEFSPARQPDGRDSLEAALEKINAAMSGTPQYFYWQHKRKDGSLIDTEVSLNAITISGHIMLHAIVRDISQRIKAEETLRRLATAVEQSVDAVLITDFRGYIQYINPAFVKISGLTKAKVLNKDFKDVQVIKGNSRTIIDEMWGTLTKGETWSGSTISVRADGTAYNEDISGSPVFDNSGNIINFVIMKRDVTRQMNLEQQLMQAQKMEAVGRLAGGIAHDFNNMLTAIMGYSEILAAALQDDDRLRSDLDEIRKASDRAASLTRQLLAFSRKQVIQPKVLDLNGIVKEMDKMLRRLIGEDIILKIDLASGLWPVKVDPGQIEQIILNLSVNARDAMPNGGTLAIRTSNFRIADLPDTGTKYKYPNYVMLSVSDNGIGIKDDIKAQIFEPFFTTKEQGKGTGLGLSTVYGIVQQNGGEIELVSIEGSGALFQIYLPKYEEGMKDAIIDQIRDEGLAGNETIMVVEDEAVVRNLICRILKQCGFKVIETNDASEAVKLSGDISQKIDLLLTDIVMPHMNGDILARTIRDSRPEMRVLYMSGYTENSFISRSESEPPTDLIQKPFKKESLVKKIREILDRDKFSVSDISQ